MNNKIKVSSPGTFMVAGEHAVLYGGAALVGALHKRLYVILTPRQDRKLIISSKYFGVYETTIDTIVIEGPYKFVLACYRNYVNLFFGGFHLEIVSEFSHAVGFGSSASVTVATLRALQDWLKLNKTNIALYHEAIAIIREIQGVGSGADVAATIYGGIIYYQPRPLVIESLSSFCDFSLIYIGYKMTTAQVVKLVKQKKSCAPEAFYRWFSQISELTEQAKQALILKKTQTFARILERQQVLFSKIGVTNRDINEIITLCRQHKTVMAAKISGSGLGDCVLCIGKLPENTFPVTAEQKERGVRQFNLELSIEGVLSHSINELLIHYG